MRGGAANRIDGLGADRQVYVGARFVERVVAGQPQLGAGLPPAMLRCDNPVAERTV